jgi:hypothetical protein
MLIDLQLHSLYSDGYLTPTELAEFIAKQGVKSAALTDHNTVSGVHEFRKACTTQGVKAITGLELYVKLGNTRFNLLWYNFDETAPELHNLLRDSQIRRRGQMRRMLKNLAENGFALDVNKILDKYTHYVPINHGVNDIMSVPSNYKKIVEDLKTASPREEEVIKHYFNSRDFGTLRDSYINFDRIARLRSLIGGQLILCHPAKYNYINVKFWEKLKKSGLDGVEVLSPHHSYGAVMYIQSLSKEFGFIDTGGSDFHRFEGDDYLIQGSWDYFKIDSDALRRVAEIL